jgi:hypothetical protein
MFATIGQEAGASISPSIATAAISGSSGGIFPEASVIAGGEVITITLTDDVWKTGAAFDAQRQAIIDGFSSGNTTSPTGFEPEVRNKEVVTAIVRTSDTVVTWTLTAAPAFDQLGTSETITLVIPSAALEFSSDPIVATGSVFFSALYSFIDDLESYTLGSKIPTPGPDMFVFDGGPWSQVLQSRGGYTAVNNVCELIDTGGPTPFPNSSKALHVQTVASDHDAALLATGSSGIKCSLIKKDESIASDLPFVDGDIVSCVQTMYIPAGSTNLWATDAVTNAPRFVIFGNRPAFGWFRITGRKQDLKITINRLNFFSPVVQTFNYEGGTGDWPLDQWFKLEIRFKVGKIPEDDAVTYPAPPSGPGGPGQWFYTFDPTAAAWIQVMIDDVVAVQVACTSRPGDFADGTVVNEVNTALSNTARESECYINDFLIQGVGSHFV